MAYTPIGFLNGDYLEADDLNHIEAGLTGHDTDLAATVHKSGAETIYGEKTFMSPVSVPVATGVNHAVTKAQHDTKMNIAGGSGNPFTAMPYVGTAPIVESGSNANGYFVKYADGTMICTKKAVLASVGVVNAYGAIFYSVGQSLGSWAANFYTPPVAQMSIFETPNLYWYAVTVQATTTTAPTIVIIAAGSSTASVDVDVLAVGRWKA